jgi:DNA-binding response OmpR family regulator
MDDSSATILLVEDDPLLRHAFRLLLEDAGYRVLEAGSAAEAMSTIGQAVPDLVLLDLGLPDRPGLDVARELRADARTRALPVVALTGRSGEAERRACLAAGCSHYFAKPVEPRELLNRIPDMLR